MGFLDKLLGKEEPMPTETKNPNPDANPGQKLMGEPKIATFPSTVVLRVSCPDYPRLKGPWMSFQLHNIEDYYGAKRDLLGKFRLQYGMFRTAAGKDVIRWNLRTWNEMLPLLAIEQLKEP